MQMDGGDGEGGGEEGGPPRSPLAGGRPELLRTESIDPAKAAATMCSFKTTPKENLQGSIDALWRRQGYMVHVDDMMQCSRHQAVLDEKVLTTLAKNILSLKTKTDEMKDNVERAMKLGAKNLDDLTSLKQESSEGQAARLATMEEQLKAHEEATEARIQVMEASLTAQQYENATLRADIARFTSLPQQMQDLSHDFAELVHQYSLQADIPDITELVTNVQEISRVLGELIDTSDRHDEFIQESLTALATDGAADDVLDGLDYTVLEAMETDDGADITQSKQYIDMVEKTSFVSSKSQQTMVNSFSARSYDLSECMAHWRSVTKFKSKTQSGAAPVLGTGAVQTGASTLEGATTAAQVPTPKNKDRPVRTPGGHVQENTPAASAISTAVQLATPMVGTEELLLATHAGGNEGVIKVTTPVGAVGGQKIALAIAGKKYITIVPESNTPGEVFSAGIDPGSAVEVDLAESGTDEEMQQSEALLRQFESETIRGIESLKEEADRAINLCAMQANKEVEKARDAAKKTPSEESNAALQSAIRHAEDIVKATRAESGARIQEAQRNADAAIVPARQAVEQQRQLKELKQFKVTVPAGKIAGEFLRIKLASGMLRLVEIPPGVLEGEPFEIRLEALDNHEELLLTDAVSGRAGGDKARVLKATAPVGSSPGQSIRVRHGSMEFITVIPIGVSPGMQFDLKFSGQKVVQSLISRADAFVATETAPQSRVDSTPSATASPTTLGLKTAKRNKQKAETKQNKSKLEAKKQKDDKKVHERVERKMQDKMTILQLQRDVEELLNSQQEAQQKQEVLDWVATISSDFGVGDAVRVKGSATGGHLRDGTVVGVKRDTGTMNVRWEDSDDAQDIEIGTHVLYANVSARAAVVRLGEDVISLNNLTTAAMTSSLAANEKAMSVAGSVGDLSSQVKNQEIPEEILNQLAKIKPLETTIDGMKKSIVVAGDWRGVVGDLEAALQPLQNLPSQMYEVKEQLPRKLDESALGKFEMQQAQLMAAVSTIAEKTAEVSPELQTALITMNQMQGVKGVVGEHAEQLTRLFVEKAGVDDLSETQSMMQKFDSSMAEELERRAQELMSQFEGAKLDMQRNLTQLGSTINNQADKVWMEELEQSIRAEMDKLRKAGGKGISKKELDARLKELRETMSTVGMEKSSALVVRCLCCDRPLADQSGGLKASASSTPIRTAKPRKTPIKENQPEVVMRGGFAMTNPKVPPGKRSNSPEKSRRSSTKMEKPRPMSIGEERVAELGGDLSSWTDKSLPHSEAWPGHADGS